MIFYTTDIGIQAAIDFGLGGPAVNLTHFRVGADFGYALPPPALPSNLPNGTSATDISGNVSPDPGPLPVIGYREVAPDTVEYTLRMGTDVGTFDFGNVGVYMNTGQLFAIAVLDNPVHKEIFGPGTAGNVIEFVVRMTFGGATVTIEYVVNPVVNANLLELSSVDLLPTPTLADSNMYLINGTTSNPIGLTDNLDAFLAFRKDPTYWSFEGYAVKLYSGTVATSTSTGITDPSIPALEYAAGRFLIQFTSGAHAGVVRAINATSLGSADWFTSTGAAVAVGTTFDIICSDTYALTLNSVEELTTVDDIPLTTPSDKRTYRVTRSRTVAGAGTLTFDCTNTFAVTGVQEWMPSDHGLVFDVDALPTVSSGAGNPSGWVNDATHVLMATALLVPDSVFSAIPNNYSELVLTFFTGGNEGYITELTNVEAVDDGITQWIRFTLSRPLPAAANVGAFFKLFYPNIIGGSGLSGGAGGGQFKVETYTAGVGGETNWNTTDVNVYFAMVFWGATFQDPSTYTIVNATNIITDFTVPEGEKLHFVEITAAPMPGAGVEVGAVLPFPRSSVVPAGYLICDGTTVPTSSYPDLYAYLGTTYNDGLEPLGHFRLPDYRGVFLRGLDQGRGLDAGRLEATYQDDALQNITGTMRFTEMIAGVPSTGAFVESRVFEPTTYRVAGSGWTSTITFNPSAVARTANQTRPKNMPVIWCIRAYQSLVNGGVVDVSSIQTQLTQLANSLEFEPFRLRFDTIVVASGRYVHSATSTTDVIDFSALVQFDNTNYTIQVTRESRAAGVFGLADGPTIQSKTTTAFTLNYGSSTGAGYSYYWEVKGAGSFV